MAVITADMMSLEMLRPGVFPMTFYFREISDLYGGTEKQKT